MTSAKKFCMSKKCNGCACYTCNLQNTEQCCGPCWDCEEQSEKLSHLDCSLYVNEI